MNPKVTDEQRKALANHKDGEVVRVKDEESGELIYLVTVEDLPTLWENYIRTEVQKGLAKAVEPWEVASIKAEGRKF